MSSKQTSAITSKVRRFSRRGFSLKTQAIAVSGVVALAIVALLWQTFRFAWKEKSLAQRYFGLEELANHLNAAVGTSERSAGSVILSTFGDPPSEAVEDLLAAQKQNERETELANQAIANVLKIGADTDFSNAVQTWRATVAAVEEARKKIIPHQIKAGEWRTVVSKRNEEAFHLRDVAFAPREPRERVVYYNAILRAKVAELRNYLGLQRSLLASAITAKLPLNPAQVLNLEIYHQAVWSNKRQIDAIKSSVTTPKTIASAVDQFELKLAEVQPVYDAAIAAGTSKTADGSIPTEVTYPVDTYKALGQLDGAIGAVSERVGEASTDSTQQMATEAHWIGARSLYIFLFTLTALGAFVYWFQRRVLDGVLGLAAVADEISAGDMTSRAPVHTADEIGVLGSSFNLMIESLLALEASASAEARVLNTDIEKLLEAAKQIENGDISARAPEMEHDVVGRFAVKFNSMVAEVERHSNEVQSANLELGLANSQLASLTVELQNTQQETDTIFATVRQGLFLLAHDGSIGAQTSGELNNIFQAEMLAHRNFFSLLRPLLPEKRHSTVADYLGLLFDPRKNDKQLQKFNPLKRVELNFPRPEGGFQSKHIEFTFQRIVTAGIVARVLVTATDITDRVKLEDQVRAGEERREKQLELLFELLQVESIPLRGFIDEAERAVERINGIFMESAGPVQNTSIADKVQRVFRIAHTLKSKAASLGLLLFERAIHGVEEQLNLLRRNPALVNEDLLNALISIANFQAQLEEASELIHKVSGLRRSFAAPEPIQNTGGIPRVDQRRGNHEVAEFRQSVESLVSVLQSRTGKKVRVHWQLDDLDALDSEVQRVLKDAVLQLTRNAVVHGIELPGERQRIGKEPSGHLFITIKRDAAGENVKLAFRDDGAGLNLERIREKAIKEAIVEESEAKHLSTEELVSLIFEPGFSTAENVTEDAGRGVGLDVLRSEIVDRQRGLIHIEFAEGRFAEFKITIPLQIPVAL